MTLHLWIVERTTATSTAKATADPSTCNLQNAQVTSLGMTFVDWWETATATAGTSSGMGCLREIYLRYNVDRVE
jgi:hypothetical protein